MDELTIKITPIPGIMADVPVEVRMRRLLKLMLRGYGLKASWPTSPETSAIATQSGAAATPTHSPAPRPRTRQRANGAVSPEVCPDE